MTSSGENKEINIAISLDTSWHLKTEQLFMCPQDNRETGTWFPERCGETAAWRAGSSGQEQQAHQLHFRWPMLLTLDSKMKLSICAAHEIHYITMVGNKLSVRCVIPMQVDFERHFSRVHGAISSKPCLKRYKIVHQCENNDTLLVYIKLYFSCIIFLWAFFAPVSQM